MFNCAGDAGHVVQHRQAQCEREDDVPFAEEGALGEGFNVATGALHYLHTKQG